MWLQLTEEIIEHAKGNDDQKAIITKKTEESPQETLPYKKEDKGKNEVTLPYKKEDKGKKKGSINLLGRTRL